VESAWNILRSRGLRPKRSWGQNFLDDDASLERIVGALELQPGERVVELGAGLGHLTQRLLAAGAEVVALERDPDLVDALRQVRAPQLRVVSANIARVHFADIAGRSPVAVVGNIPYHLTSHILFELLDQRAHVSRAVLTVQKEVADRLAASPGGRDYGILSVLLGMHFELRELFTLSPALFHPPPKVTSAVIRLNALPAPRAQVASEERFRRLVKAGFARRRKTILNSLKSDRALGSDASLSAALHRANIEPTRRAETLSVEQFAALERALAAES
jgi:16S rRNA (adenine1518-N6/adenine1519-N6)-dimethyltransferase